MAIVDIVNYLSYQLTMSTLSFIPEQSLGFMTITTNRLLNALLRRSMREAGIDLSGEQWGVLIILWDRGELPQEELIRLACMDKTGMSRLLGQLETKGLIARRPDASSARRKRIQVTQQAQALREQAVTVARDVLNQALKDVPEDDLAVCMRVLETVKRTVQQSPVNRLPEKTREPCNSKVEDLPWKPS